MIRICLAAVPLTLSLSACSGETAAVSGEDDQRRARGEVLGGSISDSMIPLDTVQSKSPPLKIEPGPAVSGEAEVQDESEEDEGGAATEPTEAAEAASVEEPSEN